MGKAAFASGFTAREVAGLLGLSVSQVLAYVRAGVESPGTRVSVVEPAGRRDAEVLVP